MLEFLLAEGHLVELLAVLSNFSVASVTVVLSLCTYKACDRDAQRTIRKALTLGLAAREAAAQAKADSDRRKARIVRRSHYSPRH